MKQFKYFIVALSALAAGCSNQEDLIYGEGEGTLRLNVSVSEKVETRSNAMQEANQQELLDSCKIRIFDSEKLIRKYKGTSTFPTGGIMLKSGDYRATVETGDSVPADFAKQYYKGEKTFAISQGIRTQVDVKAQIQNTLVKVAFDPETMDAVYNDYHVEIGSEAAMLNYTKEDAASKTGYYMLDAKTDSFTYVLTTTTMNGEQKVYKGTALKGLQRSTLYTVNFRFNQQAQNNGAGMLELNVEEEPLVGKEENVTIYQRPVFTGMFSDNTPFDVNQPLNLEPSASKGLSVWISFSAPVKSIQMMCNHFPAWNVGSFTTIDMQTMSQSEREQLALKGIVYKDRSTMGSGATIGIEFTSELMSTITKQEGAYTVQFNVSDQQNGQRTLNWIINVSNATVTTEVVNPLDVYTNRAILRGKLTKEPTGLLKFEYRVQGTTQWSEVPGERVENNVTASVNGLEPNTTYEYRLVDGSTPSSIVEKFTTEAALQLENAGFENWSGTSPLLMYGEGQQMWWDSGNHGSATMKKNVTTNDTEVKHSGKYSAKLASQFVGIGPIGKFAAGNAFVGKYVRTDGTDGVLGWGRPFNSRPKALHGYIRYVSATVGYECEFIKKGQPDKGQIFVALGDWAGETDGETWPVIVRTKDKHLFDQSQNNPGTIAFGEQTWHESTEGTGMVEFTIPLNYWKTDRKPQTLILVCTASKYGDYFAGAAGSTMWLDDLEFIYE